MSGGCLGISEPSTVGLQNFPGTRTVFSSLCFFSTSGIWFCMKKYTSLFLKNCIRPLS